MCQTPMGDGARITADGGFRPPGGAGETTMPHGRMSFSFLAKIVKKDFQFRSNETSAAIWAIFKVKNDPF